MAKRNIKNKALWKKRISQALKGKKRKSSNRKRPTSERTRAAIRYREDYRSAAVAGSTLAGVAGLAGLGYGLSRPGIRKTIGKPLGKVAQGVGAAKGFLGTYLKKGEIAGAAAAASQDIGSISSVVEKAKDNFKKELTKPVSAVDKRDKYYQLGYGAAKQVRKGKSGLKSIKEKVGKRITQDTKRRKALIGFASTQEAQEARELLFFRISQGKSNSQNMEFARKRSTTKRKPISAVTRKKISRGVTAHYDRVGRKKPEQERLIEGRKNLRAAASAFATVAGGVATLVSARDKNRLVRQQLTQGNARAWIDSGTNSVRGLSTASSTLAGIFGSRGRAQRDLMKIDIENRKLPLRGRSTTAYEKMAKGFHRKLDLEAKKIRLAERKFDRGDR
jgi:hypothetical protein